jgi:sugar-specific transcriptional regulator TrmB
MTDQHPERVEVEAADLLKEFGFSEYEAYVLVYLLRLGSGTAKDIAEMDHVPRTRVYDAVESLHEAGLVDIQYTSPRRYTAVSRETTIRKLGLERETKLTELNELFEQLEPAEASSEEFAVWTVTGNEAVASRVLEFIDDAEEELIYMTVDDLLTDAHIERLRLAADRGVSIYIAGISEAVQERILAEVPSADLFETLWEWDDVGAGSLLFTDKQTVLISVLAEGSSGSEPTETAVWATGAQNSLVVVMRAIFSWRLNQADSLTNGS